MPHSATDQAGLAASRSTSSAGLPLAFRVPNPPNPFFGRERESALAVARLTSGCSVAITGPAGVGKSALAFEACARLRTSAPSTLIDLDAETAHSVVERLLMRIATRDALPPDWRVLGAEPELARMTLIDLADAGRWTILLDDLAPRHFEQVIPLLERATKYSTQSRWIVTSRYLDAVAVPGMPVVTLADLEHDGAVGLLAACAPGATAVEVERIVARTGGNPAALIRASHAPVAPTPSRDAEAVLHVLGALGRPLNADIIAALAHVDRAVVASLPGQVVGVAAHAAGLWLRRDARPSSEVARAADRVRLGAELAQVDDDDARLEAISQFLVAGDHGAALRLLGEIGETACERGHAADLWAMLNRASSAITPEHDELHTWRAWCAFEWGDPRAHADVERFRAKASWTPTTYLGAHLAARLSIAVGDFEHARELAQAAAHLATNAADHDRAFCRLLRAIFSSGHAAVALDLLGETTLVTPGCNVEAQVIRIECCAVVGRAADAAQLATVLLDQLAELPPASRLRAMLGVARAYLLLHRLRDAERTIEALLNLRGEAAGDAVSARTALEIAAAIAAQRGNFRRVRDVAERLLVYERAYPVRALFVRSYTVTADRWQLSSGVFRENLARLARDAAESHSPIARDISCYCNTLRAQLDGLDAVGPDAASLSSAEPHTSAMAASLERYRQLHDARWGSQLPPHPTRDEDDECEQLHQCARSVEAALAGDLDAARDVLTAALDETLQSGRRLIEFEARQLLILVLACAGDWRGLAEQVSAVRELASTCDSAQLADFAEFFAGAHTAAGPRPETIESWAAADLGGPRVRWARWLLGESVAIDRLERLTLESLTTKHQWRRARPLRAGEQGVGGQMGSGWRSALGADATRHLIWMPNGATCDLAQHDVLWQLIARLVAHGGEATKETLVSEVWQVADYHPLNHDNRLRVAVRKLRDRLVECGGPTARDAVVTTDDGYALGGRWRVIAA